MNFIKERFKNYITNRTKFSIASDLVFVAFIVAFLIPQSRMEIITFVNKIRVAVWSPSINEGTEIKKLNESDYQMVLEGIDGKKYDFSNARGKVVFLNLWATWCPPCQAEMPAIQELYDKYKDNDKVIFCMLSNEESSLVKSFIVRKAYTFPVYINKYRLPDVFKTRGIPATFVISKSGKIVISQVGAASWSGSKMIETMDRLIKE